MTDIILLTKSNLLFAIQIYEQFQDEDIPARIREQTQAEKGASQGRTDPAIEPIEAVPGPAQASDRVPGAGHPGLPAPQQGGLCLIPKEVQGPVPPD